MPIEWAYFRPDPCRWTVLLNFVFHIRNFWSPTDFSHIGCRAAKRSMDVLQVPSGQIGYAWEWYHWIGLEKDINSYKFFNFFIFDLEYLIRVQKVLSHFMQKWIQSPACLDHGLHFSAKPCSKNMGDTSIVLWITAHKNSNIQQSNPK